MTPILSFIETYFELQYISLSFKQSVLPSLKSDVHLKLHEVDSDLNDLGLVIPDAEHERRQLLTDVSR